MLYQPKETIKLRWRVFPLIPNPNEAAHRLAPVPSRFGDELLECEHRSVDRTQLTLEHARQEYPVSTDRFALSRVSKQSLELLYE